MKKVTFVQILTRPWIVVSFALLLRLTSLALLVHNTPPHVHGIYKVGYEQGQIARSIAEGHGFASPFEEPTGPTAWCTPIYPYLMAGVFKLFGVFTQHSQIVLSVLQSLFSALICIPLFYLGRTLAGEWLGAVSAWLWAFDRAAMRYSTAFIWDTALATLLLTVLLWMTFRIRAKNEVGFWAAYGALWALTILVNPSVLTLFPFYLCWAVFQAQRSWKRSLALLAVALLVTLAGLSPWLMRNAMVFGKPLMLRSNFGLELWLGNNPSVPDSWSWWLHPTENAEENQKFAAMGELPYMAEKQRLAIEFIRDHPADVSRFVAHRFVTTWTCTTDPVVDSWRVLKAEGRFTLFYYCSTSVFAFAGLLFVVRRWRSTALPFVATVLVFPLIYYITHTNPRYRHPIDPALTLLAVYGVGMIVQACGRLLGRTAHSAPRETTAL